MQTNNALKKHVENCVFTTPYISEYVIRAT